MLQKYKIILKQIRTIISSKYEIKYVSFSKTYKSLFYMSVGNIPDKHISNNIKNISVICIFS